ncbi:hypothetical protein F9C11_19090 [Amycolatopsis sp. VS8301801F10]|uniref:hypothetical protein n=1 Tax=Amycolatopsis sp. VS8301801F10 TaxID=2652442 RepID=UPI0038FD3345
MTRPADTALAPAELGAARYTRHSFARSFLRQAARERWAVSKARWEFDDLGHGEAVYRIDAGGTLLHFAVFSTVLQENERTDRVIAKRWDVTAALVEGPVPDTRMAELRREVPRQEAGRANAATLVWTRANRSERFFAYVVSQLAKGAQPDIATMGDACYVLRSTAFYSNGKFGLADFDRLAEIPPLRVPYRAQMLAAWLLREFSYDLVEHCAARRNPTAATLSGDWRRYLGLGNATGLGMVPFVVNHPHILDAWCSARELPLARALDTEADASSVQRASELLDRARRYFRERDTLVTAPYLTGPELAERLAGIAALLSEFPTGGFRWRDLDDRAAEFGAEARAVLHTVLVELDDSLDAEIEHLLTCDQRRRVEIGQTCGQLRDLLAGQYDWTRQFDFADPKEQARFWFSAEDNEEPRRGRRGQDRGESMEHPIDIARAVHALRHDLAAAGAGRSVAEFLLEFPWHRGIVARVQSVAGLRYGEVRANLLADDFLPLHLQRFQLALYGMENYSPQSTDWLRVTLFSGAPRARDVESGVDDDWLFTRKPGKES